MNVSAGLKKKLLLTAVLCSAGFIIYSNVLGGAFQFDDLKVIIENPAIKKLGDLPGIWRHWPTRFITTLSFAINYRLEHFNVFYYHLFNLLIHLGSAMLVWWLAFLTLSSPGMRETKISGYKDQLAFFAGLIFAAHPVQTEAVSYITQRATCLCAFFCLASVCFYVKSNKRHYYAASLFAMAMAMFTKENAAIFPLVILLYDLVFLNAEKSGRWKRLTPVLMTLLIIPLTMLASRSVDISQMRLVCEDPPGITPAHYFFTQLRVIVTYIRLLFLPLNQNLDYDYHIATSITEPQALASLFLLGLILFIAVKMIPKYKLLSFGVFWFFLTLLPESGVIPIADVIFEHRLYLPMAGFSLFLAGTGYYIFGRRSLKAMRAAMLIAVIFYSVLAYNRNLVWADNLVLWNDAVIKSPNKPRPYNNRGYAYLERQNADMAIRDFTRAIQLKPDLSVAFYYNLGNAYAMKGSFDEAVSNYDKAILMRPSYYPAYVNRGIAYAAKGGLDNAIADYTKAIQLDPAGSTAYIKRSLAYLKKDDHVKALEDMLRAEALGCRIPDDFRKKIREEA